MLRPDILVVESKNQHFNSESKFLWLVTDFYLHDTIDTCRSKTTETPTQNFNLKVWKFNDSQILSQKQFSLSSYEHFHFFASNRLARKSPVQANFWLADENSVMS